VTLERTPEYNDGHIWDRSWSEVSTTIDGDDPFMEIDRIKFRKLGEILPAAPARTLEVGSGSARMSTWLARSGYQASCLDRSIPALKAARSNFAKIGKPEAPVIADGSCAPYRDGTFDVVLSTGLLEHFVDPQPILNEMVRVLKPGALFYSDIVPDKFSLFRALRFPRLKALLGRPEPFERSMDRGQILAFLGKAGLTQIEVVPMGIFPPLIPGVMRLKPVLRGYQAITALPIWERFDGVRWSEPLALYYFCTGTKPLKPQ
jgi:SAM-dependent methyltransferase